MKPKKIKINIIFKILIKGIMEYENGDKYDDEWKNDKKRKRYLLL